MNDSLRVVEAFDLGRVMSIHKDRGLRVKFYANNIGTSITANLVSYGLIESANELSACNRFRVGSCHGIV